MKRNLLVAYLLSGVAMIGMLAFSGISVSASKSQLAEQNRRLTSLTNTKNSLLTSVTTKTEEAVMLSSGIDSVRVTKDDGIASELFDLVCTWDSATSYRNAREVAIERYHLSEDSKFLTTFLPPVADIYVGGDEGTINEIDAYGTNSTYLDMKSHVIKINGDVYRYFTLVTIQSSNKAGATADGLIACTYNVDVTGAISNLDAYTIGAY